MKNLKEETKILLSRAYILAREDNYQHFDIIARMKECVDEIDQECKRRSEKMKIEEIRIRKLDNGYEYERYEDKKSSGGVKGLTGFEVIKVVVAKIERWEKGEK